MRVYAVDAKDGEPDTCYATKGEALREGRRAAREYAPAGEVVEVEEWVLVPLTKAVIVSLINAQGRFLADSRVIARFPSKRKDTSG